MQAVAQPCLLITAQTVTSIIQFVCSLKHFEPLCWHLDWNKHTKLKAEVNY